MPDRDDRRGSGTRNPGVHGPRADHGAGVRRPDRPVRPGGDGLRDAGRSPAVRSLELDGLHGHADDPGSPAALADRAADLEASIRCCGPGAFQRSRVSLCHLRKLRGGRCRGPRGHARGRRSGSVSLRPRRPSRPGPVRLSVVCALARLSRRLAGRSRQGPRQAGLVPDVPGPPPLLQRRQRAPDRRSGRLDGHRDATAATSDSARLRAPRRDDPRRPPSLVAARSTERPQSTAANDRRNARGRASVRDRRRSSAGESGSARRGDRGGASDRLCPGGDPCHSGTVGAENGSSGRRCVVRSRGRDVLARRSAGRGRGPWQTDGHDGRWSRAGRHQRRLRAVSP